MVRLPGLAALIIAFCMLSVTAFAQDALSGDASIWKVDIKGAVGPATADHVVRGIEQAQLAGANMVILQIDTPGGLDASMRTMIKAILSSNIPIVGYVSPAGARAASAGTYILYACHVAAMAPATNLGAATPVQIGAPTMPKAPTGEQEEQPGAEPGSAMERKIINDAVAYIQSLAELRGRNAEWATRAVREGASLPAEQALEEGVIDIVAADTGNLLTQLDGRTVDLGDATVKLDTQNSAIYTLPMDWRSEFLAVITDPNVAYLLMMVGIYGLIIEFYNPGLGVPGVLGAVCLLLALYAFQVLPVSYAGLGLILLGVALMTAEAFAPSFGILGLGGIVAFVIGSIFLMDTDVPGYQIAMPMIFAFATFSAGILVFGLSLIIKARRQAVVTGLHHLVGAVTTVESLHGNNALVRLEGELWHVDSDADLQVGDAVSVTAADGVVLQVKKQTGG